MPDRPLLVVGFDVLRLPQHETEAAGIHADTPDPTGGVYERDASGAPNGVVHEAAFYRVCPLIPQLSPAGYPKSLAKAHAMAHGYGLTGWFDARVEEAELKAYADAQRAGTLKVYMSAGLYANPRRDPCEQIERFARWRREYECDNLRLHTVKIFVDGVPESKTAALLEPYAGTDDCGLALWSQDALNEICLLADTAGFDLHFHTLADRAVRMTLDALEYVQIRNGRDRRAQLAHLQLVDPADMSRFNRLGAIASDANAVDGRARGTAAALSRPARRRAHRAQLSVPQPAQCGCDARGRLRLVGQHDGPDADHPDGRHALADRPARQPAVESARTPRPAHDARGLYGEPRMRCASTTVQVRSKLADASFAILDRNPFAHPVETFAQTRVIETCFRGEVVRRAGLGGLKHASGGVPSGDGQRQHLLGRQHVAERVRQRGQRRAVEVAVRYRAAIREIEIARRASSSTTITA